MMKPNYMGKLIDGVNVEWKSLKDLCDLITTGKLNANAMEDDGIYPFFTCNETPYKINTYAFDLEAIIISGNGSQVGHLNYYKGKFNAYQRTYIVSNFNGCVQTMYLFHYLRHTLREYITQNSRKGSVPYITMPMLENLRIPIPPLKVQEEIVRILDTFTGLTAELIAELSAELTTRKKQYNYYRDKLLTFEEGEVEWKPLRDIAEIYDGTHQTPKYKDSGVKFVSVQNIRDLYATQKYISVDDFEKYKYKPRKNDLFMTRIGDIGTCAVVENDDPLAYYVTLTLIRVNQSIVISKYLKYIIESSIGKSELYKRTLVNATPIKINLGEIGKINIPVPPLPIQERIVSILDKFDALTSTITEGLPHEIELRKKQYEYYRNMLLSFPKKEV